MHSAGVLDRGVGLMACTVNSTLESVAHIKTTSGIHSQSKAYFPSNGNLNSGKRLRILNPLESYVEARINGA